MIYCMNPGLSKGVLCSWTNQEHFLTFGTVIRSVPSLGDLRNFLLLHPKLAPPVPSAWSDFFVLRSLQENVPSKLYWRLSI
jgi:hypothetical protein